MTIRLFYISGLTAVLVLLSATIASAQEGVQSDEQDTARAVTVRAPEVADTAATSKMEAVNKKEFAADSALSAEQFGLRHLSEYLGLRPDDIGYRSDYTRPDSFRLAKVVELMQHPLGMIDYTDQLRQTHVVGQPEIAASILFADMAWANQKQRGTPYKPTVKELERRFSLYFTEMTLNQLLTKAVTYLEVILPRSREKCLAFLTPQQRRFLTREFRELVTIEDDMELLPVDVIDSLEKVDEAYADSFVTFGYRYDRDPLVMAGIDCLREILLEVQQLRRVLASDTIDAEMIVEGVGPFGGVEDKSAYLGFQPGFKVGGPGNDYYQGNYDFILDFGGDDVYDLSYDVNDPHGVIIIDLGGDDRYRGKTDFCLGSGCLSAGILLDFGGNDTYEAKSFSLGSGFFGFGILYDAAGDDHYSGDTHVQGAGTFGLGLVIDEGGQDKYHSAVFSQGYGFVGGYGAIFEMGGSDVYYAGGKYLDVLRYQDRYLTLAQGFGYGMRPWMSGGVGAIVDLRGNDLYSSEIFGQGSSYWWSLGILYDSSGNDNYQSFQYAQGAAAHMTLGTLIDDGGDDNYFARGVSQGCGHDYSCGLLLDRKGNDTYTSYDLSQAAGSANGAGVLVDTSGNDRYFIRLPRNSQGYGNPRREFGSIGLFIDLGGDDQYDGNGRNNYYWRTHSKWGGGMDIELHPTDTTGETEL
jgi:hypothetical protein